jgi:hypothetical protein
MHRAAKAPYRRRPVSSTLGTRMQPDLIREIAQSIVQEQFLLNWKLYAMMLCIAVVGGAAGYWSAPYIKKRAETAALKADLDEILRQLAETTKTTETIRAAIAQGDWAQREWRSTRRLKLEALLTSVYSLDLWLDSQQGRWMNGTDPKDDQRPMDTMKLLGALYFPDLKPDIDEVWLAHQQAFVYIVQVGSKAGIARLGSNAGGYAAALEEFKTGWAPHVRRTREAIARLEASASKLMPEIAGA